MSVESDVLACQLTSVGLQKRKAGIISSLKLQLLDKQETAEGYVYTFPGKTDFLAELMEFVRLERLCCPFFKFELTIRDEKSPVQLKLTGPDGTKGFLKDELGL